MAASTFLLDLNGHCFLCLREHVTSGLQLSSSSSSKVNFNSREGIKSLTSLLCYLAGSPHHFWDTQEHKKCGGGDEGGSAGKAGGSEGIWRDINDGFKSFENQKLPLCGSCHDILQEIQDLHESLMEIQEKIRRKTQLVRERVVETTRKVGREDKSGRDKFMESLGKSDFAVKEISSISSLVLRVHERIINKATTSVFFPSIPVREEEATAYDTNQDFGVIQNVTSISNNSPSDCILVNLEEASSFIEEPPSKKQRRLSLSSSSSGKSNVEGEEVDLSEIKVEALNASAALEECTCPPTVETPSTTSLIPTATAFQQIPPAPPSASAGMSVCGVPVDPTANYVMITTNVTDPETGALRMQPVLINVAQLQIPPPPTVTTSIVLPTAPPPQEPPPPPPTSGNKTKSKPPPPEVTANASTAHSIYENELRLQLCDVCNERIPRGPHGSSHLACHVGSDHVSYCATCEYAFISPFRLLDFHRGRHLPCTPSPTSSPIFKCDLCDHHSSGLVSLRKHLSEHERDPLLTSSSQHNCPLCPSKFKTKKSLQLHLADKHVFSTKMSGRQTCDICKSYFQFSEIEDHLSTAHGISNPLKCRMCLFTFSNLEGMIKHQGYAKSKNLHEKTCHLCVSITKFISVNALRHHYFQQHGLGQKIICESCSEEFLSRKRWEEHKRRCHTSHLKKGPPAPSKKRGSGGAVNSVPCPDCGTPQQKLLLLRHRIDKHDHPPLTCSEPFCTETFKMERDFKLHLASAHHGYTVYSSSETRSSSAVTCDQCGRIFSDRGQLNVHKRSHSEERPFKCDREDCKCEYKSRSALNNHVLYSHMNGEKRRDHVCEVCGRGFFTQKMLGNHKLVHTGERPFSCQHCGQRFRQEVAMRTHERSHLELGEKFRPKGEMERKSKFNLKTIFDD